MRTALLALGGLLGGLPAGCGDAPATGRAMTADAGGRAAMLSGAPPVEIPTRDPEPAGEDDRRAAEIAAALARDQALIASGLGRGDRTAPAPEPAPTTTAPAAAAPPAARPEPAMALPEPRWNQAATRPADRSDPAALGFDIEPPSLVPTADRRRTAADRAERTPPAPGVAPGTAETTPAPRDAALDAIAAIAAAASVPDTDEATSADWLESVRPGRGTRPDGGDRVPASAPRADRPAASDPVAGGVLSTAERALPPNPVSVARSDLLLALLVDGIDHPNHALPNAITSALSTVGDPEATIDASLFRNVPENERDLVNAFAAFAKALTPTLAPADATDSATAAAGDADAVNREAMLEAIDRLRAAVARTPQLAIRRAALCRQVDGFGVFDGLEQPHRFLAGSPNAFIVYLELDEFHSERREGGAWVTELEQRVQIYNDRDARSVWATDWSEVVDVNANRRRDFFTAQVIELPPAFSLGVFHLKVQVRDRLTGAESETSIEFEMVAGGPGLTRR
ncbi:MAG: hypothetical protein ACYTEV_01075 [Planctomycetota bacterium]|jgi:hypothetical protein